MRNKEKEILDTATLLFLKKGIKKTSVELICRNCGISKKTFYNYYPDKKTIIEDVVKSFLSKAEKYIDTLSNISPNAASELINLFKFIQSNMSIFTPVFINDLLKFYPVVNEYIAETRLTKFLPFFIQNVKKGINEGLYRESLNGKLTGELYFRQIDMTLEDVSLTASEKLSVLSYINIFFLHGIINDMGTELLFSDSIEKSCKIF